MRDGGVMHRGHHEADASLAQRSLDHFRANHHLDPHLGHRIGSAGLRAQVPVAVLGNNDPRTGDDERGCG